MLKKYINSLKKRGFIVHRVILVGVLLLVLVLYVSGDIERTSTTRLARNAVATMKQQCISLHKLKAADRTKSLFRLIGLLQEFRNRLAYDSSIVTDEQLEQCADSMHIGGIALLDDTLRPEASGYMQNFFAMQDKAFLEKKELQDILDHPARVYAERLQIDDAYYDVCAIARTDAPGILLGFYRQPTGLITNTENDLAILLTGLKLERDGQYAIVEDGYVLAASNPEMQDKNAMRNDILLQLSSVPQDDNLHRIYAEGAWYWGYCATYEEYTLYIYYPVFSIFSVWLLASAIFLVVYTVLCFLYFMIRNQALYENQLELKKSNAHLIETVNMLQALETIYFTLFYVDLENDSYESIYIAPWLEERIPPEGRYTQLMQSFIGEMVLTEYQQEIRERMSRDFILEALCKENITDAHKSFYTDYQAMRDGQVRWCRVSAVAVDYDAQGKPMHMLALLQDVHTEKTREAEYQERILKEANEAKVANIAKTEFLRRISHDIRTPINGIQGYVAMASKHPEDMELQEHCRRSVTTVMHTLLELVNSVLDMSKLESSEIVLETKPFDLLQLLDEINIILQPQAASKNIIYQITWQDGLPQHTLLGSPQHLRQIFINLLGNAVKYGKTDGYIHLDIALLAHSNQEEIYRFIISDNGIGMSESFQAQMFEPFAQEAVNARTTYEGAGLGLAIVKKLVEMMDGSIEVHSQKGVGTSFFVTLRFGIASGSAEDRAAASDVDITLPQGLHVLLVEDNSINIEIAEYMLSERGAIVTKAHNGREAVDLFAVSEPGFYDIIFMDIMMPVMDGLEATRAIREMHRPDAKSVPISAMSANAFSDDVQRSLDAGMNAHISKPMDEKTLLSVMAALLKCDEA